MSAHTCKKLTPGCFRCELNADEMAGALEGAERDYEALLRQGQDLLATGEQLTPDQVEELEYLQEEVEGLRTAIHEWHVAERAHRAEQVARQKEHTSGVDSS